jgi:flagellar M-ring protein FliF
LEAIKNLVGQLGPKRLMLMGGVALALLAALAFVATRGSKSEMGFLYTDLDPSAAATITEKLKAQNIEYTLSADGTSIMAPQEKLAELRMSLAGEKLGGKIGYEVLDEEQPFGVSASRAKMNETRAIEGELSKSIQTIQDVSAARVHIVMPERAMFANESRKATAAVTVKTKGHIGSETISAIRYLVSSSVPELSPDAVSVVDQTGALLARAGDPGSAGAGDADERQAAVEGKLRQEVESLLEPIVGQGKVRAEVSAQIDRDQTREESHIFDPDKQVVSHEVSVETGDQNRENDAGPGTVSVANQLPEAQAQPATPGASRQSASNQTSEDKTYDNSSTKTVTVRAPGKVTRLSVAVMVDGGPKGLPPAQIQRLQRLVENAVGADVQRGDSVVVESMAFNTADPLADKQSGILSLLSMDRIWGLLQLVVIGVIGLLALRMIKPKFGWGGAHHVEEAEAAPQLASGQSPEMLALAERAADGDADAMHQLEALNPEQQLLDQEIALAQVDGRIKLSALKRIGDAISASPPEAASVIRQWMNA